MRLDLRERTTSFEKENDSFGVGGIRERKKGIVERSDNESQGMWRERIGRIEKTDKNWRERVADRKGDICGWGKKITYLDLLLSDLILRLDLFLFNCKFRINSFNRNESITVILPSNKAVYQHYYQETIDYFKIDYEELILWLRLSSNADFH